MDDKQLLAQFAAAALTGLLNHYGNEGDEAAARRSLNIAEAMLAEFKQRTEQKGNE